jgi:hypothetical protein
MKVAVFTPQEIFLVLDLRDRVRPKRLSIKNSNYTIGNLTRDLPAYSTLLQPTVTPRATL